MNRPLEGRIVVVTGANGALGKVVRQRVRDAAARAGAQMGAAVAITGAAVPVYGRA